MDSGGSSLKLRLGAQNHFTAYDGELVSILLGLGLARAAPGTTQYIWILNDSQTAIRDITNPPPLKSGQHIRYLISKELKRLLTQYPDATVAFIWCAKGSGVEGHEKADALAKAASKLTSFSHLPVSYKAIQRQVKELETMRPGQHDTDPAVLRRLMNSYQPIDTYKALAKLSRPDATIVTQLRAGHCPLNAYLFRFHAADSHLCTVCGQKESVEHYLLLCKKFVGLRRRLFTAAAKLKIPRTRQALLTDPRIFQSLADYGRKSYRFYKARYPKNGPAPAVPAPPPLPPTDTSLSTQPTTFQPPLPPS